MSDNDDKIIKRAGPMLPRARRTNKLGAGCGTMKIQLRPKKTESAIGKDTPTNYGK
jgi:hypothetical protein